MKCKNCGSEMIKMIEPTRNRYAFQAFICPNVKTHVIKPSIGLPMGAVYCEPVKEEKKVV